MMQCAWDIRATVCVHAHHLVHVKPVVGESESDLTSANCLGQHLPCIPLGLVDLHDNIHLDFEMMG